jgi:hypothetical protein
LERRLARSEAPAEADGQLSLLEENTLRRLKAEMPEVQANAEAHVQEKTNALYGLASASGNPLESRAYRARVDQFLEDFAGKPGSKEVADHALGDHGTYRTGAAHQIDVACRLGPDRVQSFEASLGPGDRHAVDIVTTDGFAIECKAATGDAISATSIYKGVRQGEIYLDNHKYKGTVVVCPDGNLQEAGQRAARGRDLFSDVRVCELDDLERVLQEASQRKLFA